MSVGASVFWSENNDRLKWGFQQDGLFGETIEWRE